MIGDFGDDDALFVFAIGLKVGFAAHDDGPAAFFKGGFDPAAAHDDAPCGKIGALNVLAQLIHAQIRIVDQGAGGVNNLPQIVGGDVGGHAHGNPSAAIHQQVGETGGQNGGLG